MAYKLKRLLIDRIDCVDRGANPEAHIVLFKRATPLAKNGDGVPMTTQEILEYDARRRAWSDLRYAFLESVESIAEHASPDEQAPLLLTSVEEFAAAARAILSAMALPDDVYKRALGGVDAVAKAGRVIAGQRLQRLKQAVMALQNIITEAEPAPTTKGLQTMAELDDLKKRADTADAAAAQTQVATLEKRQTELLAEVEKLQPADPWKGVSEEVRKRIEASEERVAKAEAEVRKRDCIGQVKKYDRLPVNPDDHWAMFDALNGLPDAVTKQVYAVFDSHQELARTSALFKAQGARTTESSGGSAYAVIEAQAQDLVTKGVVKTFEQGIDRAIQDNPDLYAQFEAERRGA